jgi:metal-responsive CopG/Arc/MetJ family transcriptional regulator
MAVKPVQISMDSELLERIDADPETRENGRSAMIRRAVRLYLEARKRREIDAELRAAYGGRADELLEEVSDLLERQEWPPA